MRPLLAALVLLAASCGPAPLAVVTSEIPLVVQPAGPADCSADAAPAIQAAVNAVRDAGGGTVFIPNGCHLWRTPVAAQLGGAGGLPVASMRIVADLGAVLVPDLGPNVDALTVQGGGAVNAQAELVNLTWLDKRFLGCDPYPGMVCPTPPAPPAARTLVTVNGSHNRVRVTGMTVDSIWAARAHLLASTLELTVEDFGCFSCYAGLAQYMNHGFIELDEVRSAVLEGIHAVDYVTPYVGAPTAPHPAGNRHTSGAAAWAVVKILPRRGFLEGYDQPTSFYEISRIFCDEGTQYCVGLDGGPTGYRARSLRIEGMTSSVASLTGAGAAFVRNADSFEVIDSVTGYTPSDHTAFQIYNVGSVYMRNVFTDMPAPGATRFYADPLTKVVELDECQFFPDPSTTSLAQRTIVTSGGVTTTTCNPAPCQ